MLKIRIAFGFELKYFMLTLLLLAVEVLIGAYAHDDLLRPYGGDFLVVILIYCLVKSFLDTRVNITALCVLLFAYGVEISQYFHLIRLLGLEHSRAAQLIMGTTFSWSDMLMYSLGMLMAVFFERGFNSQINML